MKTLLVVYTDVRLSAKECQTMKRCTFNTKSAIKVGDLLSTDQYDTAMQVVEVLKRSYKYVNLATGELSNLRSANTRQVEIRFLKLEDNETNVLTVTKI